MPEVYNQLRDITTRLEQHYKDVQDFEFTIQDGKLYMLQTRNGKRTGPAAVRDCRGDGERRHPHQGRALLRVEPDQLNQLLHPGLDEKKPRSDRQGSAGIARRGRWARGLYRR